MKKETLLKVTFSVAFLALVFLVIWIDLPAEAKRGIEKAIRTYQGILLSIGTLILISLLGLAASQISSDSAERREKSNRKSTSELKISEYRQVWITEMRSDLSKLASLLLNPGTSDQLREALYLRSKIEMRLNLEEVLAIDLNDKMLAMWSKGIGDGFDINSHTKFIAASNVYLKSEWSRLKRDIRDSLLLEEHGK